MLEMEKAEASEETGEYEQYSSETYPVTRFLVFLLLFVYLISSFPDFHRPQLWALLWGVFYPPAIDRGEIWRVITGNLMHANWSHLLNNGFGIFIFGRLLEPLVESAAMEFLLFLSAVMCHLFSYFLVPGPTLGASGMVFGLISAYLTLVLLIRRRQDKALFWQELRGALGYLVLILLWNFMDRQNINVWGHLGGMLAGIFFAFGWYYRQLRLAAYEDPPA